MKKTLKLECWSARVSFTSAEVQEDLWGSINQVLESRVLLLQLVNRVEQRRFCGFVRESKIIIKKQPAVASIKPIVV